MSTSTATEIENMAGHDLGKFTAKFEDRDAILYALSVGAHAPEIPLIFEEQLEVIPTYALAIGLWAVEAAGKLGAYDPVATLHVSQTLNIVKPLRPGEEIKMEAAIGSVWDKKSAALIEVNVCSEYFDATYGIWAYGSGNFGGERGPSSRNVTELAPPTFDTSVKTTFDQAVLYRLTGDRHPLHVLPSVAEAAGFNGPILHGLCVLGASVLALTREVEEKPSELRSLQARFSAPVYPGDELRLVGNRDNDAFRFDVSRGDQAVLSNCSAEFVSSGV